RAPRADVAVTWSQTPPVTDPTPLRVTRPPAGRRATGFVLVAKGLSTDEPNKDVGSEALNGRTRNFMPPLYYGPKIPPWPNIEVIVVESPAPDNRARSEHSSTTRSVI